MSDMSALELDALAEIFNISVGRAAAILSELTGEAVSMSVPLVHLTTPMRIAELFDFGPERDLACVTQRFEGRFNGQAMLMFAENNGLEVVRMMLGSHVTADQLTEMEQDALNEIGNIILNTCFSALADMLNEHFTCSLPQLQIASASELLGSDERELHVLFLQIQLALEHQNIQGYLAFIMGHDAQQNLHQAIRTFLSNVQG